MRCSILQHSTNREKLSLRHKGNTFMYTFQSPTRPYNVESGCRCLKRKSIVHDVQPHFLVLTSYGKFTRHYIHGAPQRDKEREGVRERKRYVDGLKNVAFPFPFKAQGIVLIFKQWHCFQTLVEQKMIYYGDREELMFQDIACLIPGTFLESALHTHTEGVKQ